MFNVALEAWKTGGGWRQLPVPNIACSGIPVKAPVGEWKALADGDARLESALERLHTLFRDADTLGSLIDPRRAAEISDPRGVHRSFDDVDWDEVAALLERAQRAQSAESSRVLGSDARVIAQAATLMSRRYSLVVTNVPYLQRGGQAELLRSFADSYFSAGRADLATMFVLRAILMAEAEGTVALVTPQNWLYLKSFEDLRRLLLNTIGWDLLAVLGLNSFESIASGFVDVFLGIWTNAPPSEGHVVRTEDVSSESSIAAKKAALISMPLRSSSQLRHTNNPLARIQTRGALADSYLSEYATSFVGMQTGDTPRYARCFWELPNLGGGWEPFVTAPSSRAPYTGRDQCLFWEDGKGSLATSPGARVQGLQAWGRRGVAMAQMGALNATLYDGEIYDQAAPVIIPKDPDDLRAVWAFLSSPELLPTLRAHYAKSVVAPAAFVAVPFEIERWRAVAEEAGPLPEPWSDDPTQWLFAGRPEASTAPLQVAVARLVGYRWPEEPELDDLDVFADADGIVCLPSVAGESSAADRVQQLLAAAFGAELSAVRVKDLLDQAGSKRKNLADWLRDDFFRQHCALFGNRPFVWHIWDGQRDGFSALVNYHRLDHKTLEKLTFTYLGQDWVERQRAEVRDGVAGAEARLSAALELQKKLEAILNGEAPLDIFVRWKDAHEQSVGWHPDLNDGVRLNVRPLVTAGVLRAPFNIHWRKDRGKNPDDSERRNDKHLTLTEKIEARKRAGLS
jgi:hypothetical protein